MWQCRIIPLWLGLLLLWPLVSLTQTPPNKHPQYLKQKAEQMAGWGMYSTRDMLSFVHLPDGFELNLDFTYQGHNFNHYLNEVRNNKANEEWTEATLRAKALAHDFTYFEAELYWTDIEATIRATSVDGELYVLYEPKPKESKGRIYGAFKAGVLWNRPGTVEKKQDKIHFQNKQHTIEVYSSQLPVAYKNFNVHGPYLAFNAQQAYGISTGSQKSLEEIRDLLYEAEKKWDKRADGYQDLSEIYKAVNTSLHFGVIYEPNKHRVVATVNRDWNVNRGGYSFFGWDNFCLGYLASLSRQDLAYSTILEHLSERTEYGFVPNCSQGNGRMTWDRSQPPIGSVLTREVYKKYPEDWFLEAAFPALYEWNRWWVDKRMDDKLLCLGSEPNQNPFNDPTYHNLHAAALESGLDDSPMYDPDVVTFNTQTHLMELYDVGLNGLYVADCEALADIAEKIGKKKEARLLKKRAQSIREAMQEQLWSEDAGIYLNKRTTGNKEFHKRLSPTLFYAMNARAATKEQIQRMMDEHFYNEEEFWGEYVLPSVARNDPEFEKQRYWKGAIWAPLNFLTYLGLRYNDLEQPAADLAEKSAMILLQEWTRKGYVPENYCAYNGYGDDPRIKSDPLYAWGALMGIIPMIQQGYMPKPETELVD